MTPIPSFDDWLELLGLDSVMAALLGGAITADAAEDAIRARWESYPDVSQDYVAILEQALHTVNAVRLSIEAQQDAVSEFNRLAQDFQLRFEAETGRLMTPDEEIDFERLADDLRRRIETAELNQTQLQREVEQSQGEVNTDTSDVEKMVDEAVLEYEEALGDYEDAVEELESLEVEREDRSPWTHD